MHGTIQELSINENTNPYKIKRNNISTTSPFPRKSFKKYFECGHRSPISTINYNTNISYRFRKPSSMEQYYDEPTHVPIYKKKIHRTDFMGLLNHVEILKNFTIKYGLPLPQYIVYLDPNS